MPHILAKYIPPVIALFDFIRKPKPRRFHPDDMYEISKKILFEPHDRVVQILEEMYDTSVRVGASITHPEKTEVWIDGKHAFDVWAILETTKL